MKSSFYADGNVVLSADLFPGKLDKDAERKRVDLMFLAVTFKRIKLQSRLSPQNVGNFLAILNLMSFFKFG